MSKMKFVLNRSGVRSLMKSDEMQAALEKEAYRARSNLGEGYSVTTRKGKNRSNAEIAATTQAARRENIENNTILKALKND